ncbi:MAG: pentapeptide repeat-containing protein [Oligoflexus sp.]
MQEVKDSATNQTNQAESHIAEQNPQLLNVMLAALGEYPEASGLSQEQLVAICDESLRQGTVHNRDWLISRLKATHEGAPVTAANQAGDKPRPSFREVTISQAVQPEDEDDWQRILERHSQWVDSVLHPTKEVSGGRANLSGADLRAFDLSGVDLRGAILNEVNLEGCNLRKANLATALLRRAKLKNACLEGAKLRRSDISYAELEGADFRQADLRLIVQEGVDFEGAKHVEEALR